MNSQAEAKSDKNSVATLNMHENWLRMLQDDEPPKSSWRPRKSTKSCGPSRGKIGPTEPRSVQGKYQDSRCANREKMKVPSTQKLNEN